MRDTKTDACKLCACFKRTNVFDLCTHPQATYSIAGKLDQHTTNHMRRTQCGEGANLFTSRVTA